MTPVATVSRFVAKKTRTMTGLLHGPITFMPPDQSPEVGQCEMVVVYKTPNFSTSSNASFFPFQTIVTYIVLELPQYVCSNLCGL